jgi:hypothetical protein
MLHFHKTNDFIGVFNEYPSQRVGLVQDGHKHDLIKNVICSCHNIL